jgi:hypothetical protein
MPIFRGVTRERLSCAGAVAAVAATSLVGCANNHDNKPFPAYQRGYDAGQGGTVTRLIKQQGELPVMACSDSLKADKLGKGYSFDDAAVYRQGCLDAVRDRGISPTGGF